MKDTIRKLVQFQMLPTGEWTWYVVTPGTEPVGKRTYTLEVEVPAAEIPPAVQAHIAPSR
jgi:hypothetical protein